MTVPRSFWSQEAPQAEIHRVLARFGLPPASLESIAPVVSGAGRHAGLRVRADGREWVLKGHTSARSIERLALSHPLELRLAEVGFPVAPLCRALTGATLVEDGAVQYALHGWVDGRQIAIGERDELLARHPGVASELAMLVGRMHLVSAQQELGAAGSRRGEADRLLTLPRLSLAEIRRPGRRLFRRLHALRLNPAKSAFERWIISVLPEMASRAEWLAGQSIARRVGRADLGLIHDDLNWENLVFDEAFRVRALLDFDNATVAPWVLEVGAAAVVLVGTDPRTVEEFVSAYEEASRMPVERDLVRVAMELKCVRSILTSIIAHLDGNGATARRALWCHHLHESLGAVRRP
ncbi:phosphotransferase [Janibacter cremeus]|uniref:phosphotransferase n=1 Tax=Janibacter cremeus TaxID=1285192 RepID=UPI0023F66D07|nr:phosphotransferase [Janibacter cremeus]WEV76938.1 phosphotransferase [Janibacter cremeus]